MVDLTAITPVGPRFNYDWLTEMRDSLIDGNNGIHVAINYVCPANVATEIRHLARGEDEVIADNSTNVAHCRNLALLYSRSAYIAQFDSDDVHIHGGATHLVEMLEDNPDISAAYGAALDVTPTIGALPSPPPQSRVWDMKGLEEYRISHINERPPIGFYPMLGCAGVIRRTCIGEGWDESGSGRFYEENNLIRRLANRGGIATTTRLTLLYRRHKDSLIATHTTDDMEHATQLFNN